MKISIALIVLAIAVLAGCNKETPDEPSRGTLSLRAEDASCTEAWLKASTALVPATVALVRDNQRVKTYRLSTRDSLLIDENLLPNHLYSYQIQKLGVDSGMIEMSTSVQVMTMDTTSHNWLFDPMLSLGDGSSSVLYDVAIIRADPDSQLVYAVGEINVLDTNGQFRTPPYNVAKWDGKKWELSTVLFHGGYAPIRFIFAFHENDIWFGMGYLIHWDGRAFNDIDVPAFYGAGSSKMWGSVDGRLYVVGNDGIIAYSPNRGVTWQHLESGTRLTFRDIWGATDPRTGKEEILAIASTYTPDLQGSVVLGISGNSVTSLSTDGMSPDMHGVWFVPGRGYFAVGAGIHQKRRLSDSLWSVYPPGVVTRYYSAEVRGQDINDVFVVGSFGEVVHFNGRSWARYFSDIPLPVGALGSVAIKGNLMIAVGQINASKAIILIGRR